MRSGVSSGSPENLTPSSSASHLDTLPEQDKAVANSTSAATNSQNGADTRVKTTTESGKSANSTAQTSSSATEGEASGRFRKMTKTFGNAKDALVKLAKNE